MSARVPPSGGLPLAPVDPGDRTQELGRHGPRLSRRCERLADAHGVPREQANQVILYRCGEIPLTATGTGCPLTPRSAFPLEEGGGKG